MARRLYDRIWLLCSFCSQICRIAACSAKSRSPARTGRATRRQAVIPAPTAALRSWEDHLWCGTGRRAIRAEKSEQRGRSPEPEAAAEWFGEWRVVLARSERFPPERSRVCEVRRQYNWERSDLLPPDLGESARLPFKSKRSADEPHTRCCAKNLKMRSR